MINPRGIAAHLQKKHGKTIKDNTLARLGKTEAEIPACRFCGKPVMVEVHGFSEICSSSECKSKLTHLHRSESVSKQQRDLAKAGKHRFQSKNLTRDANGKSIKHIQLAKAQVKRGLNPLQKHNRPKAENGKDLYVHNTNIQRALGHAKHPELFTKEYIKSHFIKDNRFLIVECMKFFNYSYPTINRFKAVAGITVPNKREYLGIKQKEVADYIRSIYSGTVLENDHEVIAPYELDIYIPEKKIAIEFNGLMYHSIGIQFPAQTDNRLVTYHKMKTDLCREKGIQLLHIYESEWLTHPDRWKSVISYKLGISSLRIHARSCEIREEKPDTDFLAQYHLQGPSSANIAFNLYYKGDIVATMTFGKPRYNKKVTWELHRFCVKSGFSIPGAASRLLKHFRQKYPGSIVSYANLRWSDGSLYKKLGFTQISVSEPSYYYFKPSDFILHHRSQFQKHKLSGILSNFDPKLSETENMLNNGYRKIYDCGSLVFKLE